MTMLDHTPQDDAPGLYDSGGALLTDVHAEEMLLGKLILSPELMTNAIEIVKAEDLSDNFNRQIFSTMAKAFERGENCGIEELVAALGGDGKAHLLDGRTVGQYKIGRAHV